MSRLADFFKTGTIARLPIVADVLTGNIQGLEYSYTTANSITVAKGNCFDSLNTIVLTGSASQVVAIGTTINQIYNLFLCDDGLVKTDTDVEGATLLAGAVTALRWIGFVKTNASGDVSKFWTKGDNFWFDNFSECTILTGITTTTVSLPSFDIVVPSSRCDLVTFGAESNVNDGVISLCDDLGNRRYGGIRTYASQSDTYYPWMGGNYTTFQDSMMPINMVKKVRFSGGICKMAIHAVRMIR